MTKLLQPSSMLLSTSRVLLRAEKMEWDTCQVNILTVRDKKGIDRILTIEYGHLTHMRSEIM